MGKKLQQQEESLWFTLKIKKSFLAVFFILTAEKQNEIHWCNFLGL
jgi:hypothetical protein